MSVGAKLRQIREERGMPLETLADLLDIPLDCMKEVEEGKRRLSAATLAEVASILGVDVSYFEEKDNGVSPRVASRIGARLRRLREQKGLTLHELSQRSGVSLAHISEIERGRSTASLKTLEKLASALEVSTSYLLQEERSETLGNKVRRLREKIGLTQKELADQIGISHSLIGQIETDRIQPSLSTLSRLAEALGVSTCYFLMEEEEPTLPGLERPAVQELVDSVSSWTDEEIGGLTSFIKILNRYRRPFELGDDEKQEFLSFLERCNTRERKLLVDLARVLADHG